MQVGTSKRRQVANGPHLLHDNIMIGAVIGIMGYGHADGTIGLPNPTRDGSYYMPIAEGSELGSGLEQVVLHNVYRI